MPYGSLVKRNKPLWVLMVTNCFDSTDTGSCWYAWLRSSLLNTVPPERVAKRSSILGIGYLSKVDTGLIVCLKSPQILTLTLSGFNTVTIGEAQSETCTGSRVPSLTNLVSSLSTFSRRRKEQHELCNTWVWQMGQLEF